jgi:hypothetical protein
MTVTTATFTQSHFAVLAEVLRDHRISRGDSPALREITEALARRFTTDNPRFSRARFLAIVGITGPNLSLSLTDREQFMYDHVRMPPVSGEADEVRHSRRARRAIALAAAECELQRDHDARIMWETDPEDEDAWCAFLYEDDEQLGHRYGVRLKSGPYKDPLARVVAAELALEYH